MRSAVLTAVALLVACNNHASPQAETSTPPAAAALMSDPLEPSAEYSVAGHTLRLITADDSCVIQSLSGGDDLGQLTLALHPPCYLLTWRRPPPTGTSSASGADARPLGSVGEPMAWQYGNAQGFTVLAVIGDPVSETLSRSSLYRLREQQGLHCVASVQGILLHANKQIELSAKRDQTSVYCAELGLEEKDFWLLAHP